MIYALHASQNAADLLQYLWVLQVIDAKNAQVNSYFHFQSECHDPCCTGTLCGRGTHADDATLGRASTEDKTLVQLLGL